MASNVNDKDKKIGKLALNNKIYHSGIQIADVNNLGFNVYGANYYQITESSNTIYATVQNSGSIMGNGGVEALGNVNNVFWSAIRNLVGNQSYYSSFYISQSCRDMISNIGYDLAVNIRDRIYKWEDVKDCFSV